MTTSASDSEVTFVTFTQSFPHVSSSVQSNFESATPFSKDQPPVTTENQLSGTNLSGTHMTVGNRQVTNRVWKCTVMKSITFFHHFSLFDPKVTELDQC